MPALRRYDIDELLTRPGTYVNPQTEVVVIVDDAADVDSEIFEDASDEWVLVSDETPVDEHARDDLLERFGSRYHPGTTGAVDAAEDDEDEIDEIEPDPEDPDEL
jgi:hypothetical protein